MKIGVISQALNMDSPMLTLDGEPASDPRQLVLPEFCSVLPTEFSVHEQEGTIIAALGWGNLVGLRSACDVVMAEQRRNSMRRWCAPEDRATKIGIHHGISVPTRTYVFDFLVHEDVYQDRQPRVRVIEMGELGAHNVNDNSREFDVLDVDVHVKPLGVGIERFRVKEIPNYIDLLNFACGKTDAQPGCLRGYRTRIEYPVFGTCVQFAIDLPVAPAGDSQKT